MTKRAYLLARAEQLAAQFRDELTNRGLVDRIEIAGSIRRRCSTCNDVEIVAIPRTVANLVGEPDANRPIDDYLHSRVAANKLRAIRGNKEGAKAKSYEHVESGIQIDLFLVTAATWGVQLALRTGPAAYSKMLVTPYKWGGLLPNDCTVKDGRVWRTVSGEPFALDTPEERDLLELCGGWVEPEQRGRSSAPPPQLSRGQP